MNMQELSYEDQYKNMLMDVLNNGTKSDDRTGVGTTRALGKQLRINLQDGFPLLTLKRTSFRQILTELRWFLSGSTNIKYLVDNGCNIWNEWADETGDLGLMYGAHWRRKPGHHFCYMSYTDEELVNEGLTREEASSRRGYNTVSTEDLRTDPEYQDRVDNAYHDQIANLVRGIKDTPNSRRLIVDSWDVNCIKHQALACCHNMFQVLIMGGKLNMVVTQRSADLFLGVPYNVASYAILTHVLAYQCGYEVGELLFNFGDAHVYHNHWDQVLEAVSRESKPLPTLRMLPGCSVDNCQVELDGYTSHPYIKAKVAV